LEGPAVRVECHGSGRAPEDEVGPACYAVTKPNNGIVNSVPSRARTWSALQQLAEHLGGVPEPDHRLAHRDEVTPVGAVGGIDGGDGLAAGLVELALEVGHPSLELHDPLHAGLVEALF